MLILFQSCEMFQGSVNLHCETTWCSLHPTKSS